MATAHNDPKLLYAINGVRAYHIVNGKEECLTPAAAQTLSLLMVPTSSSFADLAYAATANSSPEAGVNPEEDFYLHLHLPPELDLPLPATTQIYHKPPTSYLIPRWDLGPNSGAFTRIEFPSAGERPGIQEDVDTFETILAQCTAFLERAPPPKLTPGGSPTSSPDAKKKREAKGQLPPYNPAQYQPGEAYAKGSQSTNPHGQIVLVDEEDGSVIGELADGYQIVEDDMVKHGSKEPVEITLPAEGSQQNTIGVAPVSPEYLEMAMHPAYRGSMIVSNAAAASRLIVAGSDAVGKLLQGQADAFTRKTKPTTKPVTFKPTTREHIRRINAFTGSAVGISAKTAGSLSKIAQNVGASIAGHNNAAGDGKASEKARSKHNAKKGYDADGKPLENFKPGLLNKSMIAFSTVMGGVEQAGRHLLSSTSDAATTMVAHKWGPEAGEVSRSLGGGVRNVGLVYIDVTGVSRRALIKSVAKGMVVGHTSKGESVIVSGNGGASPGLASGSTGAAAVVAGGVGVAPVPGDRNEKKI